MVLAFPGTGVGLKGGVVFVPLVGVALAERCRMSVCAVARVGLHYYIAVYTLSRNEEFRSWPSMLAGICDCDCDCRAEWSPWCCVAVNCHVCVA